MKKLISLFLILCMACMLVPALAEDSLVGTWYLKEGIENGQTVDISLFGMSMTFDFREDGTFDAAIAFGGEEEKGSGTWTLDGETVTMTINGQDQVGSFVGGVFNMEMNGATMVFSKEAPAEAAPAAATVEASGEEAFFGTWKIGSVEVMGQNVPVDMLSSFGLDLSITLTVEAGKASLGIDMNGESKSTDVTTAFKDGKLSLVEGSTEVSQLALTDNGQLLFELPVSGNPLKIYLVPAT